MTPALASSYLPQGLPAPQHESLTRPFWDGLRREALCIQRCARCGTWQFGPEWICHQCHSFDLRWESVAPRGVIYSWERVWHAANPALKDSVPYLVVLVELPHAGNVRLVGNLLGDPKQEVCIGTAVDGVFERHDEVDAPYTLLQWRVA